MWIRFWGGALACALTSLLLPLPERVHAQSVAPSAAPASVPNPPPVAGTVVALDAERLVIDLGSTQVQVGATLALFRSLEVKHPVTGQLLRDRFPNGELRVVQIGNALSIAAPTEAPPRTPAVGDTVELKRPGVAAAQARCDECMKALNTQREILELWYATLGLAPEERIRLFEAYLKDHASSPYQSWLVSEVAFFRNLNSTRAEAPGKNVPASVIVNALPMDEAQAGVPVEYGVYVPPESKLRSVRLFLRKELKRGAFSSFDIPLDARGQGRIVLPKRFVAAPGFKYFVEAYTADNRSIGVLGSAEQPKTCRVLPRQGERARQDLSRVRFSTEYVSFDGLSGRDYYYLAEGDFLLRIGYKLLEGVRVGYGHYRGEGGTLKRLDELKKPPVPTAFTYGYLEFIFAFHEMFAIMPRLEVGLGRPAESQRNESNVQGGAQIRVRIGRARGTNLVLAGETVPEIGQRAFVGLNLGLVEKWPLAFEVHVTDQPANTDELGVRAVFEVGHRPIDVFALAVRASYQGRTIDHAGPGLGLAATFDW
jgi:hypothetical protein